MYVAIHSWSFRERFKQDESFDIFQAMDMAQEMGFKGMEIMTGKANMPPEDIGTDTVEGLRKVLAYAEDRGLLHLQLRHLQRLLLREGRDVAAGQHRVHQEVAAPGGRDRRAQHPDAHRLPGRRRGPCSGWRSWCSPASASACPWPRRPA